jgi:hypothetical protein
VGASGLNQAAFEDQCPHTAAVRLRNSKRLML